LATSGVTVDAHTATPDWYGERLDVVWAIDVLRWPESSGSLAPGVPAGTPGASKDGEYAPDRPGD
jgi:hypothetical protein